MASATTPCTPSQSLYLEIESYEVDGAPADVASAREVFTVSSANYLDGVVIVDISDPTAEYWLRSVVMRRVTP